MSSLSTPRVQELLLWDPKAERFLWRTSHGSKQAGTVAGNLHHSGTWRIGIDGRQYSLAQVRKAYGAVDSGYLTPDVKDPPEVLKVKERYNNAWGAYRKLLAKHAGVLERAQAAEAELKEAMLHADEAARAYQAVVAAQRRAAPYSYGKK